MRNSILKGSIVAAIVAVGFGGIALAQKGGHDGAKRHGGGIYKNFDEIDLDKNGYITKNEISAHKLTRFRNTDTNNDGYLTQQEVFDHAAKRFKKRMEKRGAKRFAKMDKNGDGRISLEEINKAPSDKKNRMFNRLDKNNDGAISRSEAETAKKKRGQYQQ